MLETKLHADIAAVLTTSGWRRRQSFFYKDNLRIQLMPTKVNVSAKSRERVGEWVIIGGAFNGAIICKPDLLVIGHFKVEKK